MSGEYPINLIEIPTIKRTKTSNLKQIIQTETQKLISTAPKKSLLVALDEHGKEWTTLELAKQMTNWNDNYQEISFLIGGPDGWDQKLLKDINIVWSLSKMTLPHQLVKVILVEQLYRAWSIINKHPYHRN